MGAQSRVGSRTCLRAAALFLACALGLALGTVAGASHPHKHPTRGIAAVAVTGVDDLHAGVRTDLHADLAPAIPVAGPVGRTAGTADSSTSVSTGPAHAPQVRGPPVEAAA